MSPPEGNPAHLGSIAWGFAASKCLLTAASLNLFGVLESAPAGMTVDEIRQKLQLTADRGVVDWLDALVALQLLHREGNGPSAVYTNTPTTANYAVPGKPGSMHGILAMMNTRLYPFWDGLEDALRTNRPQNESKHAGEGGGDPFEAFKNDAQAVEQFAAAMEGASHGHNLTFAANSDFFSKYKTLADFGGSTGNLAINVAQCQPHMQCTTYDRPELEVVATRSIEKAGVGDRCVAKSFNFFTEDAFPTGFDVITMGFILHDWGIEKKLALMKKAYDALPPGGAFVALDATIDDDRKGPVSSLLMSVNMLIEFGSETSFDYTHEEFTGWAKQVGFSRTELLPLPGLASACIAYK